MKPWLAIFRWNGEDEEKMPMISPQQSRDRDRGRLPSVHGRIEVEETRDSAAKSANVMQMIRTRFTFVYIVLGFLLLIALAGVVISLMLLSNMKKSEQRMRNISMAGSERFMRLYEDVSSLKGSRRNPAALNDIVSKLPPEQLAQARAFGLLPKEAAQSSSPSPDFGEPIRPVAVNGGAAQQDVVQMQADEAPERVAVEREEAAFYSHLWHDPKCSIECKREDVTIPPLLVLSLDGFSHEYLGRRIVRSLESFAECGAQAKYMYPTFPSKTFPNHYGMATGLYPESNGIVDNLIYDPSISPEVVDVRQTKKSGYFQGEPIWSAAVRQHRRMNCIFWPGCSFNITGHNPTIDIPYNKSLSYSTRVDMIVDWLTLPAAERPSMVMAYFDQPDSIGHWHRTDEEVDLELKYIEAVLNYLFTSLHKHGLLDCTNVVIVSDHGMQQIKKRIYLDEQLDLKGAIVANGVISQIHVGNSTLSTEDVLDKLKCRDNKHVHVYDRKQFPARFHYAKTGRIGDVVLEGLLGTTIFETKKADYHVTADHGYDYIEETMKAIFFARGPNVRPATRVEPFQNVELFNFFTELLRLNKDVANNGTTGLLSHLLFNIESIRSAEPDGWRPVQECDLVAPLQSRQVKACARTPDCERAAVEVNRQLDACPLQTPPDGLFYTDRPHVCYINLCSVYTMVDPLTAYGTPTFVYETLTADETSEPAGAIKPEVGGAKPVQTKPQSSGTKEEASGQEAEYCALNDLRYEPSCENWTATVGEQHERTLKWHTILVNEKNELKRYNRLQFLLHDEFVAGPFVFLQNLTRHYARRYGRLVAITGVVYDFDLNGIADDLGVFWHHIAALPPADGHEERAPSHVVRLLVRCEQDAWHINGVACKRPAATRVLAFVLPNAPRNLNCLPPLDYLRKNTARVRDVELLAGVRFFHERMWFAAADAVRWRANITEELWPL
ncbi:Ectonucleotide pyrophosphatase/phosphodiesterase C27A7.1 [Aphelenchoides fujianensis]|nr:Ectonucleotide pyrophosphatase/phosphodiesterase C27A7.1 [Aphelenchoides fujianensis]